MCCFFCLCEPNPKTNHLQSQLKLFQTLFCAELTVDVWELFLKFLYDETPIDKRRQNRGNLALISESSWIIWRVSLAHANLFRSNPTKYQLSLVLWWRKQSVVRCTAWLNLDGLSAIGRVVRVVWVQEKTQIGLPMHRSGSSGWKWATAVPPFLNTVVAPLISGANSDDRRAYCVTPRLIRTHTVLCNGDDISMSMHNRPGSFETKTSGTGQLWIGSKMFPLQMYPMIDLWLVNYFQYGATLLPWASLTGLVWRIDQHLLCLRIPLLQQLSQWTLAALVQKMFDLFFPWLKKNVVTHGTNRQNATEQMVTHCTHRLFMVGQLFIHRRNSWSVVNWRCDFFLVQIVVDLRNWTGIACLNNFSLRKWQSWLRANNMRMYANSILECVPRFLLLWCLYSCLKHLRALEQKMSAGGKFAYHHGCEIVPYSFNKWEIGYDPLYFQICSDPGPQEHPKTNLNIAALNDHFVRAVQTISLHLFTSVVGDVVEHTRKYDPVWKSVGFVPILPHVVVAFSIFETMCLQDIRAVQCSSSLLQCRFCFCASVTFHDCFSHLFPSVRRTGWVQRTWAGAEEWNWENLHFLQWTSFLSALRIIHDYPFTICQIFAWRSFFVAQNNWCSVPLKFKKTANQDVQNVLLFDQKSCWQPVMQIWRDLLIWKDADATTNTTRQCCLVNLLTSMFRMCSWESLQSL